MCFTNPHRVDDRRSDRFHPPVAGEMVRQARILAQATSDLVNAIKMDAEGESDLENSRKLLSAAKLLADATAKMVEAAKVPFASHKAPTGLLDIS